MSHRSPHTTDLIDLRFNSFSFSSLLAPLDSTGLPITGASWVLMEMGQGIAAQYYQEIKKSVMTKEAEIATQTLEKCNLYFYDEGD